MRCQFTESELNTMMTYKRPTELWVKAFDIYNSDPMNTPLQMNCVPCYFKVFKYITGK